jgi:glutamyl-tRNA synthetase
MNITPNPQIRVRMAPSPTGFFHVGSARTALFNYLFARHHGGTFVLRIEDTDMQRNDATFEQIIYDGMEWLGLNTDENPQNGGDFGPYRQSERFDIYREYCEKLIASGQAYRAYETTEELARVKEQQQANKLPPRYNGAHRDLTPEQRAAFEAEGRKPVVRYRVLEGETSWVDLARGLISWNNREIDDFVIQKSDGSPTYNFACAVDDALMKISHVIRGEDGLSNTPRQILLGQSMGFLVPQFAHLPFLLGKDRSKLSKRHGAVNLLDYASEGILPQAMFNYLALLGWNPGGGETQEIFARDELIEKFSLEGVNRAGAIFDVEKLQWMNVQYLKQMPIDQFIELARPFLSEINLEDDIEYSKAALDMARERIHNISDINGAATYFFRDDYILDEAGKTKHLTAVSLPRLKQLREKFAALPAWNHDAVEGAIRGLATELTIKPAELIHPSRMAVSGRTVGPSVFELLALLGRERVLRRFDETAAQ